MTVDLFADLRNNYPQVLLSVPEEKQYEELLPIFNAIDELLLDRLEKAVALYVEPEGVDLTASNPNSKWRIISCMQKAIRRSDRMMALNAAAAMMMLDEPYLFRRLATIAVEDVCFGDLVGTGMALAVAGKAQWRKSVGERKVLLYLVDRLVKAPKDRQAIERLVAVDMAVDQEKVRQREAVVAMERDQLIETVLDDEVPNWHRLIAAWCMSGMESRLINFRPTQLTNVFAVFMRLKVPLFCHYLTHRAKRTHPPMSLTIPFSWLATSEGVIDVIKIEPPESTMIGRLFSPAYDQYTREGNIAIKCFNKWCQELAKFLSHIEDYDAKIKALRAGIFLVDSAVLTPRLSSKPIEAVYTMANVAELEFYGIAPAEQLAFKETIRANISVLNKARAKVVLNAK